VVGEGSTGAADQPDAGGAAGEEPIGGPGSDDKHGNAWRGGRLRNSGGYVEVHCPGHPRARAGRYVREHILIVEAAIGKPLPSRAEVHHVNEVKTDNAHRNLVACQDRAYHRLLHLRRAAWLATGNAAARRCGRCGRWSLPSDPDLYVTAPYHRKTSGHATHRSCNRLAKRRAA
jgi:hypothetical protein